MGIERLRPQCVRRRRSDKHYLNYGRIEQRLFDEVVTDYERRRMFERG